MYCGNDDQLADDVKYTPIVIGLVTWSGFGGRRAGRRGSRAQRDGHRAGEGDSGGVLALLREQHGVTLSETDEVYLAAAGWTWVSMGSDEGRKGVLGLDGRRRLLCHSRSDPIGSRGSPRRVLLSTLRWYRTMAACLLRPATAAGTPAARASCSVVLHLDSVLMYLVACR